MVEFPNWFKEKYKIELSDKKNIGKFWVEINDIIKVIEEKDKEIKLARELLKTVKIHKIKNINSFKISRNQKNN